jgi:glycosyltransferase involved in cell wall biosynthesis
VTFLITPRVSIIIPVYNASQFIVHCLESITKQTFDDYEVIIINDGSSDNSAEIISSYIAENNLCHFHLISKENGGVSSARNHGLRVAKGEWIAFIDSDDWIEPAYLQNMIDSIDKYNVDLCLSGFGAYEMIPQRLDPWSNFVMEYGKLPEDLRGLNSFDYIWGRMYKKSIIDANNISFDDRIRYCEDNAFNFDYIRAAKSFSCVDAISYIYRRGHTTALSKNLVYPRMRVHFVEHAQRFCDSIDDSILIEALKVNRSLCRIMWNVVSTGVIVDILDKNYSAARARMRQPLSKSIVELYPPYTKKDKALLFFWKHSFPCLVVLVKLYYSNFERVKKFKRFSTFISH